MPGPTGPSSREPKPDWYDHPLWYDIVHWPDAPWEVRGLMAIERRFALEKPRKGRVWYEPACGSGRYLREAAKRGVRAFGADLNPKMVTFANRALKAAGVSAAEGRAAVGDMTRAVPPKAGRADFAFCLINSVRHLSTDAAVLAHLRAMRKVVKPDGLYAVGISLTHYGAEFPTEEVFHGKRGALRVTHLAQFLPPAGRFETVLNHLMIREGAGKKAKERHFDSSFRLRCFSGSQWGTMLDRAGWSVAGVVDEEGVDAVAFPGESWRREDISGYGVFVLRNPGAKTRK